MGGGTLYVKEISGTKKKNPYCIDKYMKKGIDGVKREKNSKKIPLHTLA